ncbi:hypothetical protein V5E97_09850 [Singulisphaera sp. Ch08]|uniref:Uncharacterized protein n=1 Tax=Singulisphaera sp. Ch08 TaxID=3120278 RepID=A0AAU7CMN0_9BACT
MAIIAHVLPTDKPRTINGRYASPAASWGIQEVLMPLGQLAYRVGPAGKIYADKAAAERFALARQNRLVRPN